MSTTIKNSWIFTTIRNWVDGDHPVSGNRAFDYTENADGSYTFYTRAADRAESNWANLYAWLTKPFNRNIFQGADSLWTSVQRNMKNFVNTHGGRASVQPPQIERPDWKKVKEVLEGKRPITDLGCD